MIVLSYLQEEDESIIIGVASDNRSAEEMVKKHFESAEVRSMRDKEEYFAVHIRGDWFLVYKHVCDLDQLLYIVTKDGSLEAL